MSRAYMDTMVLYSRARAGADPIDERVFAWQERVWRQTETGVTSGLVQDELAYRLVLAWLRDDGVRDPLSAFRADERAVMRRMAPRLRRLWAAFDLLRLELQPTDDGVVAEARALMARPGLAPRDAFHAAHALRAGCDAIASSDTSFDAVRGLRRIGP